MSRDRTQEIRDAMLIDMAQGIRVLLGALVHMNLDIGPLTLIGRLESHIEILKQARE